MVPSSNDPLKGEHFFDKDLRATVYEITAFILVFVVPSSYDPLKGGRFFDKDLRATVYEITAFILVLSKNII